MSGQIVVTTSTCISDELLRQTLKSALPEERLALTQVLDDRAEVGYEPTRLQAAICAYAGNAVSNFLRGGAGVPYSELLFDAAELLKVEDLKSRFTPIHGELSLATLDRGYSEKAREVDRVVRLDLVSRYVSQLERGIVSKMAATVYEQLTAEQKAIVDAKLAELAKTPEGSRLAGLSTPAALLMVGKLGGFATYTLMSTVLSALSFGSLGFGAYTLASSLLSVVLGPVGWVSLAALGAIRLGKADDAKLIRLAATCSMTALRLRDAG